MKKTSVISSFLCLLVAACATTQVTSVWKDPAFTAGQMKKVLVIGMSEKVSLRRVFEDAFVERLEARGVKALPSYPVFPDGKLTDQKLVDELMESGADTVLIARLVESKTVEQVVPASTTMVPRQSVDLYGYYATTYDYVYNPGYVTESRVAVVETNLYDAATKKLIWTGQSDTLVKGAQDDLVKSFVKTLADRLFGSLK
jgi:hypothetical protein